MEHNALREYVTDLCVKAKAASATLGLMNSYDKNIALDMMADALMDHLDDILTANAIDMQNSRDKGIPDSKLDRLLLTEDRIRLMAMGIRDVAALPDPVGIIEGGGTRPNGLNITRISVPMGVIGVIYESRPNVTADVTALCFKAGSAVILRGGSEAIHSNQAIVAAMKGVLTDDANFNLPDGVFTLIEHTQRETVDILMEQRDTVDLLIPRGGAGLINHVTRNSKVPVIETGTGNCHTYVDQFAKLDSALHIVVNAKISRPSVCNACESLLVHKDVADAFLPMIIPALQSYGVEVRGDTACMAYDGVIAATDEDYATEYNALIISVKVVDDIDAAISHINAYGTKHSECIVTCDYAAAEYFTRRIDAACVYVNASTRFSDGAEFGLGAEIGISTQKLHARGPMGLSALCSYKYIVRGNGEVRG